MGRTSANSSRLPLVSLARIIAISIGPSENSPFSAHGLRSGYLTDAENRGIPLSEAMHRYSVRHQGLHLLQQAPSERWGVRPRLHREARLFSW